METKKNISIDELKYLGEWHHSIDLGNGVRTAPQPTCYDPLDRWKVIERHLPANLSGRSVLDLGCSSGYFSVLMKQRGAGRVLAVDVFPQAVKQAQFLASWFEVDFETTCQDAHEFVLTCTEQFDYVIFLGLFYHLKYPVLVLDRVAEMTKQKLFFQTVISNDNSPDFTVPDDIKMDELHEVIQVPGFPKMMFVEKLFNNDKSNWWVCSKSAVPALLRSSKLEVLAEEPGDIYVCNPNAPFGKKLCRERLVLPRYGKNSWYLPRDD